MNPHCTKRHAPPQDRTRIHFPLSQTKADASEDAVPMECYCCGETVYVDPEIVADMEKLHLEFSCYWCQCAPWLGLE